MKPQVSPKSIQCFLQDFHATQHIDLMPIAEGMESQVMAYRCDNVENVIRLNRELSGFQKEQYCSNQFASPDLPMPEIVNIGTFDSDHFYCITKKIAGITLQDSDSKTLTNLAPKISNTLETIHSKDVSDQHGFGSFDQTGAAQFISWHDYLLSSVNDKDWHTLFKSSIVDQRTVKPILETFKRLVETCPETKCLVHGDFGSNNVLTDGTKITGVIDWQNALYGDPLYDIAGAYFWATWLDCMQIQKDYFEAKRPQTHVYHTRLTCYQLHWGIEEMYDNAISGDILNWVTNRTLGIFKATDK